MIQLCYRLIQLYIYHTLTQGLVKLTGIIELDETMFGWERFGKPGWGAEGNVIVFGMYKRNGLVVTFPVSNRSKNELLSIVET